MNESPFNAKLDKKKHLLDMFLSVVLTTIMLCIFGLIIQIAIGEGEWMNSMG